MQQPEQVRFTGVVATKEDGDGRIEWNPLNVTHERAVSGNAEAGEHHDRILMMTKDGRLLREHSLAPGALSIAARQLDARSRIHLPVPETSTHGASLTSSEGWVPPL